MKTINFCGDSFCAYHAVSSAWTKLLAHRLNVNIIGYGKSRSAHEHAIQTFNNTADYTIFCWTEAHRLYVNQTYCTSLLTLEAMFNPESTISEYSPTPTQRDKAAYIYYKYLYKPKLHSQRQIRDLYWFDNVVLSQYKGVAIHLFCFRNTYTFTNGININTPLNQLRDNPNKFPVSLDIEPANHLTEQQNSGLADKIYDIIKEHHEKTNYK